MLRRTGALTVSPELPHHVWEVSENFTADVRIYGDNEHTLKSSLLCCHCTGKGLLYGHNKNRLAQQKNILYIISFDTDRMTVKHNWRSLTRYRLNVDPLPDVFSRPHRLSSCRSLCGWKRNSITSPKPTGKQDHSKCDFGKMQAWFTTDNATLYINKP